MKGNLLPINFRYVCRIIDIIYKTKSMETLTKRSFFVLATTLAFSSLHAQTADDIVNKYVTAIGGKDAIANVKSVVMQGSTEVMGGEGNTTVTIVVGKGYKTESDFNGQKVIQCITSTGGWGLNPYMGMQTPTALPAEQVKASQMQLQLNPLVGYAASGYKIDLAGKDFADYKIKMSGNGRDIVFYINQKTSLLDKFSTTISAQGQSIDITISFSDYRKIDGGLLFPYVQVGEYPGATLTTTFKTINVNTTVDPTTFDMPKS